MYQTAWLFNPSGPCLNRRRTYLFRVNSERHCRKIYKTPKIQPSIRATSRSCGSRGGSRYRTSEPLTSARCNQAATAYAACWSPFRPPSFAKRRVQSEGYTSVTTERPVGIFQPSKGQKCTLSLDCIRRYRNQGRPAWVDVATCPCTLKRKTDFADDVQSSVKRSHDGSPVRLLPPPRASSRMKQT